MDQLKRVPANFVLRRPGEACNFMLYCVFCKASGKEAWLRYDEALARKHNVIWHGSKEQIY